MADPLVVDNGDRLTGIIDRKKVSIVAGGGRGIGKEVAQQLSILDHKVVVLDFPEPSDLGVYKSGSILISEYSAFGVDLRDAKATAICAQEINAQYGPIDTLSITVGAIDGGRNFLELSDTEIVEAVTNNLTAVHNCITAFVPYLTTDPWSNPFSRSIVALTSVASIKALRGLASYSAAKGGLRSYLMVAAVELSDIEIRLNIVAPGSTRGAMLDASSDLYGLSSSDEFATHHLSKRIIEADEVAQAILSLHQNPSMVASELVIDGGMVRS